MTLLLTSLVSTLLYPRSSLRNFHIPNLAQPSRPKVVLPSRIGGTFVAREDGGQHRAQANRAVHLLSERRERLRVRALRAGGARVFRIAHGALGHVGAALDALPPMFVLGEPPLQTAALRL